MSLQYGQLGPLAAEKNGWQVSGTAANFNGFRVLAPLLRSPYTAVFTTRSGVHGRVHRVHGRVRPTRPCTPERHL